MVLVRYESDPYEYTTGGLAVNVPVKVLYRGTLTHVPIYVDSNGAVQLSNPTRTDSEGKIAFYISEGSYDLLANGVRTQIEVEETTPPSSEFNQTVTHTQSVAMATWTIEHSLSPNPVVTLVISGREVYAPIEYPDDTHVVITFDNPKTGIAELRG